jgi:hypothetical protein
MAGGGGPRITVGVVEQLASNDPPNAAIVHFVKVRTPKLPTVANPDV